MNYTNSYRHGWLVKSPRPFEQPILKGNAKLTSFHHEPEGVTYDHHPKQPPHHATGRR